MIRKIASLIYDQTLRPHLPKRITTYNSIAAQSQHRLFDLGYSPARVEYEAALCDAIQKNVKNGDSVLVVGGGKGVSSLIAAEHSYPKGDVTTFEASRSQYLQASKTLSYHPLENKITIRHAAVGSTENAYGDIGNPSNIEPRNIPECDVLVIDAEGAEADILPKLEYKPKILIVESHGCYGSPTEQVRDTIISDGFDVYTVGYEDEDNDIAVLLGELN